jgi:hypothetical protein
MNRERAMSLRDPVGHLAHALHRALAQDLLPLLPSRERPGEQDCDIVMFRQCWPAWAVDEAAPPWGRPHDLDTVVVIGPSQDACVYAGFRLMYHVLEPNRRFFFDVAAHAMSTPADAPGYEGRDDRVTEAVDIEFAALLARLQAQVLAAEPQRAALVARYLRRCALRFEAQTGPHAGIVGPHAPPVAAPRGGSLQRTGGAGSAQEA